MIPGLFYISFRIIKKYGVWGIKLMGFKCISKTEVSSKHAANIMF